MFETAAPAWPIFLAERSVDTLERDPTGQPGHAIKGIQAWD